MIALGTQIGFGDRRGVCLGGDREVAAVNLQDGGAGTAAHKARKGGKKSKGSNTRTIPLIIEERAASINPLSISMAEKRRAENSGDQCSAAGPPSAEDGRESPGV